MEENKCEYYAFIYRNLSKHAGWFFFFIDTHIFVVGLRFCISQVAEVLNKVFKKLPTVEL